MGRRTRRWRRDLNHPGTLAQAMCFGGLTTIAGVLGLIGSFGTEAWVRWLGALVVVVGLMLQLVALHRLRR